MSYAFNFILAATKLLPYKLRQTKMVAWLTTLFAPAQKQHDFFANNYDQGTAGPFYSNVAAYVYGDVIVGSDNSVYECILATTGNAPPNATYWYKQVDNFIGVQERIKYSAQKLVFEYAINRWFRTTFRQPALVSDIYIENLAWADFFYIGGSDEWPTGLVFSGDSMGQGTGFVIDDNTAAQNSFTVWVPESGGSPLPGFYTSLQPYAEQKIRATVDKYNIAGAFYNVDTY